MTRSKEKRDKSEETQKTVAYFCTSSHLLSLSVLSIMRGIQWLVTCRRERKDRNIKDAQVIPYYCNDNKLRKLRGYSDN